MISLNQLRQFPFPEKVCLAICLPIGQAFFLPAIFTIFFCKVRRILLLHCRKMLSGAALAFCLKLQSFEKSKLKPEVMAQVVECLPGMKSWA